MSVMKSQRHLGYTGLGLSPPLVIGSSQACEVVKQYKYKTHEAAVV